MTFSQLEYFLAILHCGGFTRAAEQICISQSSLSKQIKSLENELGTELFNRESSKPHLTEAGENFLIFAEKAVQDYRELLAKMNQFNFTRYTTVRVGTLPVLSSYGLLPFFSQFQADNLRISVDLYEREQQRLIFLLDSQQLDLAILRTDEPNLQKYDIMPLIKDDLVFVCSPAHELTHRKLLSVQELSQEKFILLDPNSGIYHMGIKECLKHHFIPNIIYTNSRHENVLDMVAQGLGTSLLLRRLTEQGAKEGKIQVINLKEQVYSTCSLVKLKSKKQSSSANKFWNYFYNKVALPED